MDLVAAVVLIAPLAEGSFDDDDGGVHEAAIDLLAEAGVLEGTECGEDLFSPREPTKRWVMAVWLVRALGETPADLGRRTRFTDVDPDIWRMPYVERLADLGVTQGCASRPPQFCPEGPVTRAQMATFLVRALIDITAP